MPDDTSNEFPCKHCGVPNTFEKPGIGSIIAADLFATVVALPFFVFGVGGFLVAVIVGFVVALFFLYRTMQCVGCGKRVSVPHE